MAIAETTAMTHTAPVRAGTPGIVVLELDRTVVGVHDQQLTVAVADVQPFGYNLLAGERAFHVVRTVEERVGFPHSGSGGFPQRRSHIRFAGPVAQGREVDHVGVDNGTGEVCQPAAFGPDDVAAGANTVPDTRRCGTVVVAPDTGLNIKRTVFVHADRAIEFLLRIGRAGNGAAGQVDRTELPVDGAGASPRNLAT